MTTSAPSKLPDLVMFTATVTMTSDWHIGTGAGRSGDIDSLVQRDFQNFPHIPAKTLTGIWRDACEIVALGLDDGSPSTWSAWVDYLFGNQPALASPGAAQEVTPIPAALSVRAATFPAALMQGIGARRRLQEAITFVKPGVKIDAKTGCAEEECLRFVEMVRLGATLTAPCQLNLANLDPDQRQAAFALLFASTCLVERIGGKRRRGGGLCQLQIENYVINQWIDWIESHPVIPPPPPLEDQKSNIFPNPTLPIADTHVAAADWQIIPLTILTNSPLTIAQQTIGNVVETLDYIPGTHLLGAIISKLQKHLNLDLSPAIANTQLIVTNATIAVDTQASRPVPHNLFGEKRGGGLAKGGKVYNMFVEEPSDNENQHQLKAERQGYVGRSASDKLPTLVSVNKTVETHNTVEDSSQRPTSDVGGVYSYTAIQPNQEFRAELRFTKTLAEQLAKSNKKWWECLNGAARLGQSKKDDYGAVRFQCQHPKPHSPIDFPGQQLAVWLLSDLLLRDERLRPTTDVKALQAELETKLNVTLTLREQGELHVMMARSHRIDSWQVRWGLPRPSLVGLAAGSCFVFEVEGTIDSNLLDQLVVIGIGERRCEGFGQLSFNDLLLTQPTSSMLARSENKDQVKSGTDKKAKLIDNKNPSIFAYAQTLEKAAWRAAIQRKALRVAAEKRNEILGLSSDPKKPSMSQLGGLRSLLNCLTKPTDSSIQGWFGKSDGTEAEKDKWKRRQEKWGGNLSIIYQFLTDRNKVWQELNLISDELSDELSLTTTDLQAELWPEAVQIVIDACIRAHKRSLEPTSALAEPEHGTTS